MGGQKGVVPSKSSDMSKNIIKYYTYPIFPENGKKLMIRVKFLIRHSFRGPNRFSATDDLIDKYSLCLKISKGFTYGDVMVA